MLLCLAAQSLSYLHQEPTQIQKDFYGSKTKQEASAASSMVFKMHQYELLILMRAFELSSSHLFYRRVM